jgi:hypothetical protein
MAKVAPFHSKLVGTEVYHDNNKCGRKQYETHNRKSGTGAIAWQSRRTDGCGDGT